MKKETERCIQSNSVTSMNFNAHYSIVNGRAYGFASGVYNGMVGFLNVKWIEDPQGVFPNKHMIVSKPPGTML